MADQKHYDALERLAKPSEVVELFGEGNLIPDDENHTILQAETNTLYTSMIEFVAANSATTKSPESAAVHLKESLMISDKAIEDEIAKGANIQSRYIDPDPDPEPSPAPRTDFKQDRKKRAADPLQDLADEYSDLYDLFDDEEIEKFDNLAEKYEDDDLREDAYNRITIIKRVRDNPVLYSLEYNAAKPEIVIERLRKEAEKVHGSDVVDKIREKYHPEDFIPDEAEWDDAQQDPPVYLIYPYIRAGKLTAISSRGGIGKGHFAVLLAARASRGFDFDDLDDSYYPHEYHLVHDREPLHTLYITRGEDDTKELQSRYLKSNGDKRYFHIVNEDAKDKATGRDFPIHQFKIDTKEGLRKLAGFVRKYNASIIIFDTVDKFVNADTNKQGEVQTALLNLQSFAAQYNLVILCLLHDRKGGAGGNMADKVAGSREWTDVPRSVLQMDFDPEDERAEDNRKNTNRRVVIHTKSNDGYGRSLRFCITGKPGQSGARFPLSEDDFKVHADVTADDYELADTRKTTVRAILKERKLARLTYENKMSILKDAIIEEADELRKNGQTSVRYSYEQFEERHGGKAVWGGEHSQRQKAIASVRGRLAENGILVEEKNPETEKRIRGSDGRNGFTISIA